MDLVWPRKIMRELTTHASRTVLTVLSIAVGLFAVSLTFRTQAILSNNVLSFYAASVPAAIIVQVQPANQEIVTTLRRIPGVRAVQGVQHISTRAQIGTTWRALALTATDLSSMQVNRLLPDSGAWPAPKRTMLFERSYLASSGVGVGGALLVELEDGRQVQLPISGTAQDLSVISGHLGNPVLQGYISLDTAAWLTGSRKVNELLIAVEEDYRDNARLQALADQVADKLKDAGYTIIATRLRDASVPETYTIMTAVFQMLLVLGGLSLALSACLVINTTSAMLTRHGQQIGIMKAIGADARTIFLTYLGLVLLIALMALLIALPSAALCAWLLATRLAWLLNYDIQQVRVPIAVVAVELVAGLVTPLLASTYPINTAARVTVRAALSGLGEGSSGTRGAGRATTPIPGVPIALLYAARSMFRRKARLALTLAALVFGGAIAITVVNTQASLFATLDQVAAYWQQDLTVSFSQPVSAARVAAEALRVPGVRRVEQQPVTLAVRQMPDGSDSQDQYAIYGVLPASTLLAPTLVEGRWLTPDDHDALVVNVDFLRHEPSLALGDRLVLKVAGRSTSWTIVGVVTSHLLVYNSASTGQGVGYTTAAAFAQQIYRSAFTNRIIITTTQSAAGFQTDVGTALEEHYAKVGIQALVQTRSDIRTQITRFVSLIVVLLLVMALSFTAIGALSLVGAMSLNVLERTKEIGILRAIGSSHRHVASMVVIEGVCIGALSWLPATLLALPLSKLLSDVLGRSILSWPLVFVVPPAAPLLWLGIVVVLSACASYVPARRAAQINVRNALEHQ